jgi:hypothetical protein
MTTSTTSTTDAQVPHADAIPEIAGSAANGTLVVKGFFSKDEIHATGKYAGQPYKQHSTTLVLPATLIDGVLHVARCDKTPKVKKSPPPCDGGEFPMDPMPHWDCIGGHLDGLDFKAGAPTENGKLPVTEAVFRAGAEREISEEVTGANDRGARDSFCDPLTANLTFIKLIPYGPAALPDGGINDEISGFFLLPLPNEMKEKALIKLQDDCKVKNAGGEEEKKVLRFHTEWVPFDSLFEEAKQNTGLFMDGLLRIVLHYADKGSSQGLLADYARAILKGGAMKGDTKKLIDAAGSALEHEADVRKFGKDRAGYRAGLRAERKRMQNGHDYPFSGCTDSELSEWWREYNAEFGKEN